MRLLSILGVISLFIVVFPSKACAQANLKVLFDATKAETAGNADWVIDADIHNLNYTPNATISGNGMESNAQRFPVPAQTGISASTPETYWQGGLSAWGVDCAKQGYTVETLPWNGSITWGNTSNAQDLSNYKVFIVCEPNIQFSAAEKSAILHFAQAGGGLFMVSDHTQSDRNGDGWDSPAIWNDLMNTNSVQVHPFGFSFDLADFSQTSSNIISASDDSIIHGPLGTVAQVQWSNGTSMSLNTAQNSTVKGVVFKTGSTAGNTNVMFTYGRFGTGRFCAIGDSSPCDDGTGDPHDQLYNGYTGDAAGNHRRLLMNATIWLATAGSNMGTGISSSSLPSHRLTLNANPVSGSIRLSASTHLSNVVVIISDVNGRCIYSRRFNSLSAGETIVAPVGDRGLYMLTVQDEGGLQREKILVD